MSELKLYRAKLKTRARIMREIPREQQGWWADVCAGKTLELRDATEADIERCNLGKAAPRDPSEYLCENIERGILVRRIAVAELTEIPERGLVAHHNESVRLKARIQELEAELSRRTQPEATKPAQDLGAVIDEEWLDLWCPESLRISPEMASALRWLLSHAERYIRAALASPADALVAGDSETAKNADVCIKPEAYLVTWQNGKRRTLAFNHWIPGQPEDSTVIPLARYGVEAVEEAFELAAKTIELFDDKTMEGDYMLDATECAGIIRALKPSAIAAIQAQKDGHG